MEGQRERQTEVQAERLEPDPRYLRTINGRKFIIYAGLLELAERAGVVSLCVEILQYPTEANQYTAVCKASASLLSGRTATDIGEASPETLDSRVRQFALSMASTRAKARALRNLCGVGLTCLEELKDFEGVIGEDGGLVNDSVNNPATASSTSSTSISNSSSASASVQNQALTQPSSSPAAPATRIEAPLATTGGATIHDFAGRIPATDAQLKAINAIAKRRKLSAIELAALCKASLNTGLEDLDKRQASKLIDTLKQAA